MSTPCSFFPANDNNKLSCVRSAKVGRGWSWSDGFLLVLTILLVMPVSLFALDPEKSLTQYNCYSWTRQSGLPVNGVKSIAQSKDGYLWLGTVLGLVRFDGLEFSVIDLAQLPGVRSGLVTSVSPANKGGIWVGLENSSFGHYDGKTFESFGKKEWGGPDQNIHTVFEAADGTLWLSAQGQAARITSSGRYEPILSESEEFRVYVLFHFADSTGRQWFSTVEKGLYYWKDGKLTQLKAEGLSSVLSMTEDAEGNLWLGAENGLHCYDRQLNRKAIQPLSAQIRSLLSDSRGNLWIGTDGQGLARRNARGDYTFLKKADGLANDYVTCLREDSEGDLWIGTTGGLSQLSDIKFAAEPVASNPGADFAAAVSPSVKGGVWVGGLGGVTYFDGKKKQAYLAEAGMPDLTAKRVFEAQNGDVYLVSGLTNLLVLSGGKVVANHAAPTLVVGMVDDGKGVVASVGGVLYRTSPQALTPYQFNKDTPNFNWIHNLASGADGVIWVASERGIFRVQNGEYQKWTVADGLPDQTIQTIMEDAQGVVWASSLSGIVRLKNGKISVIGRKDGLFDDNVYAIVPDNIGNLWIDSGRGIFRVSQAAMNDFAEGKISRVESVAYNGPDSVKTTDKTNTQERVGCKSTDGRIWFPSAKGVVTINPSNIPVNPTAPAVHIDHIQANRTEVSRDKSAVVPPGKNDLEFRFVAISFSAPHRIRIRYQLEGYDKEWIETENRRSAFYTNLRPGRYKFKVTAANGDGVWSDLGDSVEIELLPHVYQTVWFAALCGGAVVAAGLLAYGYRIRLMQRKQKMLQEARDRLEEQVALRTSELAGANESLQSEIKGHKETEIQLQEKQQSLEKEIEERKRMGHEIERVHQELVSTSRQAGMAEVATGVLHNVGNVLNSVNVSATLVAEQLQRGKAGNIAKVAALLEQNKDDLVNFITNDSRGQMIPSYLGTLAEMVADEQNNLITELGHLRKNVEHIKDIVSMQQTYARTSGVLETISVLDLIEDAVRINSGSLVRHQIDVIRDYKAKPVVTTDKHKIMQILVNLLRNAKYACQESDRNDKQITIRTAGEESTFRIIIEDNGVGIPAENLTRIFNHGFTTRKTGHGFGLHSGALSAKELGGSLQAASDGPGLGATFILELPYALVPSEYENSLR